MRIGILAKGGANWLGGLYYTVNLIRALRVLPKGDQPEIVVLLPSEDLADEFADIASPVNIHVVPRQESGDPQSPPENQRLVQLLADEGIDVVFPCMRSMQAEFPTPWLPWVPDLQHKYLPEYFSTTERAQRDQEFIRIATDAALVVLSSQCAVNDFDEAYPGYREKLRVLHFATVPLPEWFDDDAKGTVRRYGLPDRYLMLPNQFWAHKNHRVAFEAIEILRRQGVDVHLVCTGRTEDPRRPEHATKLREFIKDNELSDAIHILGLLPRLDQIQLMRAAVAIVQPSLFEGWSTVVEDARALGKRVFLSDIPVHREQQPPGAIYFQPDAPNTLAKGIAEVWDTLSGGPCSSEEEDALGTQRTRVAQYGRDFLAIVRELLGETTT